MTRMTGPDCAVMCNLVNTHTHILMFLIVIPWSRTFTTMCVVSQNSATALVGWRGQTSGKKGTCGIFFTIGSL